VCVGCVAYWLQLLCVWRHAAAASLMLLRYRTAIAASCYTASRAPVGQHVAARRVARVARARIVTVT